MYTKIYLKSRTLTKGGGGPEALVVKAYEKGLFFVNLPLWHFDENDD